MARRFAPCFIHREKSITAQNVLRHWCAIEFPLMAQAKANKAGHFLKMFAPLDFGAGVPIGCAIVFLNGAMAQT
jgi:hypothetical protein